MQFSERNNMTKNKTVEIESKERFDIVDLTDGIVSFVKESGIRNGLVNIQSLHTTSVVLVQENEPLLLEDIKKSLERIAPKDTDYDHDDFGRRTVNMCDNECCNGHSHCKAVCLPTSITLNLINGQMQLGTWQRIMFIELDRARPRKIQIQILGE